MIGRLGVFALLMVSLVACTSLGHRITAINRTLYDIKVVVKSKFGISSVSDNQRVIITGPLRVDVNDRTPNTQLKVRSYARIVIIGDRRPYDVLVEAYIERRNQNNVFEEVGLSEALSKELARELHQALIESRENWNVIDDFRAF